MGIMGTKESNTKLVQLSENSVWAGFFHVNFLKAKSLEMAQWLGGSDGSEQVKPHLNGGVSLREPAHACILL